MLLSEYDIQYVTQKAIKGSVLSWYLAYQPVKDYQPMRFEFPDEDIMVLNDEKVIGDCEGPNQELDGSSHLMEPRMQWVMELELS